MVGMPIDQANLSLTRRHLTDFAFPKSSLPICNALCYQSARMKNFRKISRFPVAFTVSATLVALSSCGGGGSNLPPNPYPTTPVYPYGPTGGVPGNGPHGPILVPTGTQCAAAIPALTGTPTELSAMLDGEPGCIRLVSVEQYQDTSNNGILLSSIVGETEVDYRIANRSTRRQRRHGIEVNVMAATVSNRTTCRDVRSSPFGSPGVSVEIPLWINRTNGSIGQNIRVTTGRQSDYAIFGGNILTARAGWSLNAFSQALSAQGFQAINAARLPNGDFEIFLSRSTVVPGTAASVRSLTRAVYSLDY